MAPPREGSGATGGQDAQQQRQSSTRKSERPPATLGPSGMTASRIRQAAPASTSPCEQQRRDNQHQHQHQKKKKHEPEDSTRQTDLAELDMQSLVEANLLNYDTHEGEFSGWIYVAEMISRGTRRRSSINSSRRKSSTHAHDSGAADVDAAAAMTAHKAKHHRKDHRLVFRRRFCRLRELMCAFYESNAPACQPIDHHVIISVERVHERNKAFQFTDYEDRRLMCYTSLGADFEEWFAAFASAVRTTQVSKSRLIESGNGLQKKKQKHRSTTSGITTPAWSTGPPAAPERTRSRTDGYLLNKKISKHSPLFDNDELDEHTHTAWLYLEYPWWKLHRRRSRRYFVLSGTTLSCFSVNKEGQFADFTKSIASFKYAPEKTPFAVDVTFDSGKRLRLSRSGVNDRAMKDWVAHLQAALHYYEARVTTQEFEKSEAEEEEGDGDGEVQCQQQAQRGILV